jgi:hypothetical protein
MGREQRHPLFHSIQEVQTMFPFLVILIGLAVLALGKRLAVLGAAVGGLVGLALLTIFPGINNPFMMLALPIGLAVLGFFFAGFAKGIVNLVLLVIGALAGAAIMVQFLDLFNLGSGFLGVILAVVGGVVGLTLVSRFKDIAMIILSGLVGGLLVVRGLTVWLPFLQGGLGSVLFLVLAAGGVAYQGGFASRRPSAAKDSQAV